MELKRILCATDFSETATSALGYAGKFGTAFRAKVSLVYADPFLPPLYFTGMQTEDLIGNLQDWKMAARVHLKRYAQTHLPGQDLETLLIEKHSAEGILSAAKALNSDLIIMGTHGRTGFNRMMMGSVAETVLRESECPVLTVHPATKKEPGIRNILCPVNYTTIAKESLEYAATVSQKFDARLTVLHVVEPEMTKTLEKQEMDRMCEWIPSEVRSHCNVQELMDSGNAAEQVIKMAKSTGCDLIVLGAQHKRFSDVTVIGTTTVRVTRHSPCPVLTVIHKG
jgi:nucleotide-binding universal stress UspA family protein